MSEKISRSTAEAYVGIALAVFVGVFPMNWWIKVILMFVAGIIYVDVVFRSQVTTGFNFIRKMGICILGLVVLAALSYFPIYKQYVEDTAASLSGDLLGARETIKDDKTIAPIILIGDTGVIFFRDPNYKGPLVQQSPDSEFRVESGMSGPLVSTTVRDNEGHIVVKVENNHWTVFSPFCQDKNYSADGRNFEVLDSSLHVVLQLKILPDRVRVQGEWWDNQGRGVRLVQSEDLKNGMIIPLGESAKSNQALIHPIFEYPSKEHWREIKK